MNLTIEEMKRIVDGDKRSNKYYCTEVGMYHSDLHLIANNDCCVDISTIKDKLRRRESMVELEVLRDCDISPNTIILEK